MNSPLFNPQQAGVASLLATNVIPDVNCNTSPDKDDGPIVTVDPGNLALRAYMTEGTIATDIATNPSGTLENITLALSSPGASLSVSGTTIVTANTTPVPIGGGDFEGPVAVVWANPPIESLNLIAQLAGAAPGIAQSPAVTGAMTESKRLIALPSGVIGGRSKAFEDSVRALLAQIAAGTTPGAGPAAGTSTYRIHALFGVYGDLPILVVGLPECFVLIDTLNGNLSGPYASGTALDASALLLQGHSEVFEQGQAVRYTELTGCPQVVAADWSTTPPAVPMTPVPPLFPPTVPPRKLCIPVPGVTGCVLFDVTVPGHDSDLVCTTTSSGAFDCYQYFEERDPAGRVYFKRIKFLCPAATGGGPGGKTPPTSPAGCFPNTTNGGGPRWYR